MPRPLGRRAPSWSSDRDGSLAEIATLHDVAAVRERCNMVYRWVADGRSPHFTLDESRLAAVAGYVADVTREAYPDLNIPYHSRWRHFSAGGVDRWSELSARIDTTALERARIAVDADGAGFTSTTADHAGGLAGLQSRLTEGALLITRELGRTTVTLSMGRP